MTSETRSTGRSPGAIYLADVSRILGVIADEESDSMDAAAIAMARTIANDGLVHVFGTGHSHLVAAEMFYRAGGLAAINPILVEGLLLHAGAELSTSLERTPGIGPVIFSRLGARSIDTLILISNSGANVIALELAAEARALGMTIIAITSRAHSGSSLARDGQQIRIADVADIVIDNHGVAGDASIDVPGTPSKMGPSSTVAGAAIANYLALTTAAILASSGEAPMVFASSNLVGGDEANREALDRYRSRVRSL